MPSDDTDARSARRTRRHFLRAGAGAAAALGSATAGCVGSLPPLSRDVRYGRIDVPGSPPPDYRRWLPPPSALQNADSGDDEFEPLTYVTPGTLGEDVTGEPFTLPAVVLKTAVDYVGIGYENYHWALTVHSDEPTFVVAADVDRAGVGETLAGTGYRRAGTHRGFDLFERDDVPRALAVGDSTVVFARGSGGIRDATAVVDAATGATARLHQTNEAFARLSDATGADPWTIVGEAGDDQGWLADAWSASFDDAGVYRVRTRIYPEGGTPTAAEIERELDDRGHLERELNLDGGLQSLELDVEVAGRLVTIEHRQRHERFRETNERSALPPQVTWGLDRDRDDETVTLRHEAGDSVVADRLSVGFAPLAGDGDGAPTQFADEYTTVSPGDDLTVDVSDRPTDAELLVFWTVDGVDGSDTQRTLLLQYGIE